MENYKKGGYNHRSEGRREYGQQQGERRSSFGERKNYGNSSYSERKLSYGTNNRPSRPSYSPKNRTYGAGSKPYGSKSYGSNDRPSYSSNDRSYGSNDRPAYGNRSSYGERPAYGSRERSSYGSNDRPAFRSNRSFDENSPRTSKDGRVLRPRRARIGSNVGGGAAQRSFNSKRGFGAKKSINRRQFDDYNLFRNEEESGINQMINNRKLAETASIAEKQATPYTIQEEVRLNKFIANSGVCSRREADNFILAGVVTVNGEVITELGTKINIYMDDVRFNGERLKGEEKVYIVMNKPKGYVTTANDPHAEKTVMELLRGCSKRVFPVGRLDKNTTGVLMFTNDGEIAERLTHPSYDKKKIYQVSLDSNLKQEDYEKILSGVELSDGVIAADALEYIEEHDHRKMGIEIHSGKNRIVRRIFESLGYEVKGLDRVYFAGLTKKSLKKGEWRYLTEGEINILKMGAYV